MEPTDGSATCTDTTHSTPLKQYRLRWLMLAIVCLLNFCNQARLPDFHMQISVAQPAGGARETCLNDAYDHGVVHALNSALACALV